MNPQHTPERTSTMTTDAIRTRILAALDRGEQPALSDITALVAADPVLGAVVEFAIKTLVSHARLTTLADRFRKPAMVA